MKNKNETGRSMVEMLGILAIIGVLSAGALKGYSDAMFKYKMNKTIEEATKIFERFEELNQKDWGGTQEEVVYINTSDGTAVQWGLLEKCDFGIDGCRLPIGKVSISLRDDPFEMDSCGVAGHFGEFTFYFTSVKECIAFASVHWEQMLSVEWWNPAGFIAISGNGKDILSYFPLEEKTTIPTASDIANACQEVYIEGKCMVRIAYRSYDC